MKKYFIMIGSIEENGRFTNDHFMAVWFWKVMVVLRVCLRDGDVDPQLLGCNHVENVSLM